MEHQEEIVENVEQTAIEAPKTITKIIKRKPLVKPDLQRKTDKYVTYARELSSRGSSFWIALLGVVLQAAHTSLLLYGTSAFTIEWQKILVSLGLGLFLSSSLMIFTLKHTKGDKNSERTLNLFFWFEVFIGVFYYLNSLVFSVHKATGEWPGLDNYVFLIVGLPFAYFAPYCIKQFAYVIESDNTLTFGNIDVIPDEEIEIEVPVESNDQQTTASSIDICELTAQFEQKLQEKFEEFKSTIEPSTVSYDETAINDKFTKLENSTKLVLKEFNKKISEIPVIDETKFIKKGETIKMRTGEEIKSIQLDVPQ